MFRRRRSPSGPPGESAVAERALCVAAIAMLGTIAAAVEDGTMDDAAAERYLVESRRWLIREGAASSLSDGEKALLAKPMPEWTADERATASRRNESVGVLLWALAAVEQLPPGDTPFERLPSDVPLLAPTAGFRSSARLRPADEIEAARGAAAEADQEHAAGERTDAAAIAAERRHALEWLAGASAAWDDDPAGA